MSENYFDRRMGVIATMHRKEQAIAPILERELGLQLFVPDEFDTDCFGTFTRDIPRAGTQIEAARLKAERAIEQTGKTLAIASEGAFTPHPMLPSIAQNREIVLLLDRENQIEIIGREVTLKTNYNRTSIASVEAAFEFARSIGFPEHGLTVSTCLNPSPSDPIWKGITTPSQLKEAVESGLRQTEQGRVQIETDMRALYNPTRMQAIANATLDLVRKIQQRCPQCGTPGFDLVSTRPGLPCAACGLPTSLTLAATYQCQKCHFSQETLYPNDRKLAEPGQCEFCNP